MERNVSPDVRSQRPILSSQIIADDHLYFGYSRKKIPSNWLQRCQNEKNVTAISPFIRGKIAKCFVV